MMKLFLGVVFTLLEVHLDIGEMRIGLLPDFLGYLLMQQGIDQLSGRSGTLAKLRPWTTGLMLWSAALYIMALFNLSLRQEVLLWALRLVSMAAELFVLRRLIQGIGELETSNGCDFGSRRLGSLWLYLAVLNGIACLSGWLPVIGVMTMTAALIFNICFAAAFYQTAGAYRKQADA